jgi:hypothetical protein
VLSLQRHGDDVDQPLDDAAWPGGSSDVIGDRMTPEAWISRAVPGRLMRSLVAEGSDTPYGLRDRLAG